LQKFERVYSQRIVYADDFVFKVEADTENEYIKKTDIKNKILINCIGYFQNV